jgi:hypothetical protein
MENPRMKSSLLLLALLFPAAAMAAGPTVYRCPGPPVLYTDSLTPQEAKEKNCRTVEGAPVTVMQMPKPKPVASPAPRGSEARVDPGEQKARDSEARRILEAELRKEEERLAELQKDYNNGEPERRGDERNYQKYLDRVASMKAAIERKEADIAALKRELGKLPNTSSGER